MIILIVLVILAMIAAFKNNIKIVGYFLLGHLSIDLLHQFIKSLNHYPKPYTGVGFLLFSLTTILYLAHGAWLLWCSGKVTNSKTLQQEAILLWITVSCGALWIYPAIAGMKLVTIFYAYYGALAAVAFGANIVDLIKKPRFSNTLMMMLSLGCLAELFIVVVFGFQFYWLVLLCNGIFYLATLAASLISSRYKNLIQP